MKPTRLFSAPGTYFVTSVTWQRRPLFRSDRLARLFLRTLYSYERQSRYLLHAFVLMPEHFHLLLTPAQGTTLERAVQLIKGGYSHAVGDDLGRTLEIWSRGFSDHRIRDLEDFENHVQYIHQNPVKRGLTAEPGEYQYSSAYAGFRLDPWPSVAKATLLGNA